MGRLSLRVPARHPVAWLDVSLDGQSKGRTPLELDVAPGAHRLTLENATAHVTIDQPLTVHAGDVTNPIPWLLQQRPHRNVDPSRLGDEP
jgi:hypothetical protein